MARPIAPAAAALICACIPAVADVRLTKTRFELDCSIDGACFAFAFVRVRNDGPHQVMFDAVCRVFKAKDEYLQTLFAKFEAPASSEREYKVWGYHSWGAVRAECKVRG